MDSYTPDKVINGTFGELWVDSDYMAEAIAMESKLKFETSEVPMMRTLYKGCKVTGVGGNGTIKLSKVNSYFIKKVAKNIKEGKATRCTLITNLADPEAFGAERIAINDCVLTELTLADWESGKILEESIPFIFTGFEVLESIDV